MLISVLNGLASHHTKDGANGAIILNLKDFLFHGSAHSCSMRTRYCF